MSLVLTIRSSHIHSFLDLEATSLVGLIYKSQFNRVKCNAIGRITNMGLKLHLNATCKDS